MKKGLMALFLSLMSCVMLFAGGTSESNGDGKTTIVFWHRTSDDFTKEIAAFESENPDIDVISEAVGTDYDDLYTKYMTAIASDSLPNVGIVGQRHGIPQMYDSGKLLVIEDYLSDESLDDIIGNYWGRFIYDGKRVCIPYSNSVPVLYYNADLFEEYGIEPPKSLDEIPEIAKKLTIDTNGDGVTDIYGFNFASDTPWYIQAWVWDCGEEIVLAEDKASVAGYEPVLETIRQMVHIDKSMPANQHSTGLDDFMNGYVAMFITSSANLAQFEAGAKFNVGTAAFPGKYTILGGNALGLFAADEDEVEASVRFINYLESLEGSLTNIQKGYLPIRKSFLESDEITELLENEPKRLASIDSVNNLYEQAVNVADSTIWLETMDILSEVEANPDANIDALLSEFQKVVDQFYADYYL